MDLLTQLTKPRSIVNSRIHLDTRQRIDKLKLDKDESDRDLLYRIVTEVNKYNDVLSFLAKARDRDGMILDVELNKVDREVKRRSKFEINLMSYLMDYDIIQELKQDPKFNDEVKIWRDLRTELRDLQDELQRDRDEMRSIRYGNIYNRRYHKELK